jgi:hypothetical protein
MTYEPYAYLLTFGIVAAALLLLLDRLEKDHEHDDG